jgi:hypothetical protein
LGHDEAVQLPRRLSCLVDQGANGAEGEQIVAEAKAMVSVDGDSSAVLASSRWVVVPAGAVPAQWTGPSCTQQTASGFRSLM